MTPESTSNRMYEPVINHDTVAFMDDVQLLWRKGWNIFRVPDPHDPDALKDALKACFIERMAEIGPLRPSVALQVHRLGVSRYRQCRMSSLSSLPSTESSIESSV